MLCKSMHSEKKLKLSTSPFLVMIQTFFTRRALKGKLGTQRALQEHSGIPWAFRLSNTQGTLALRHLSTRSLGHSKVTWELLSVKLVAGMGHFRFLICASKIKWR